MPTESFLTNPNSDDGNDEPHVTETDTRKRKGPLWILVLYSLSLGMSLGGVGCAVWGYWIVTAPFNEDRKKKQRDGCEISMFGMNIIVSLIAANIMRTCLNLRLASKGRQNRIWLLNMVYDALISILLIVRGGGFNMVAVLWDRKMCGGIQNEEVYKICGVAMFRLLMLELLAVNLGILVAIHHFILLIAKCCTQAWRNDADRSRNLRTPIYEEESILLRFKEEKSKGLKQS